MMKYFAIFKDSIREARDSKVLLVLIILSTVVSLFVATVSFKPQPAETTFAQFFPNERGYFFLIFMLNVHEPGKEKQVHRTHSLALKKVELLSGEPDSPFSDYALTVTGGPVAEPNAEIAEEMIRKIFREEAPLSYLHIGEIKRVSGGETDPNTDSYRVTVHGNRAMARFWSVEPSVFFGAIPMQQVRVPLGIQIYVLASAVIGFGSWIAVLAGVIITSFFIPNMLRKGTVDLLLVKPIHRSTLLIYKYLGGLVFIFLCTTYAIVSIWFVLGVRTGVWGNGALLLIPSLTFFFAILYSISVFVSVLTRSVIATIIVTVAAWALIFVIGWLHDRLQNPQLHQGPMPPRAARENPEPPEQGSFARVIHAIYVVTPRTAELDYIDDMIVFSSFVTGDLSILGRLDPSKIVWWETLLVSGGWIVFFLALSCWWFSTKDY